MMFTELKVFLLELGYLKCLCINNVSWLLNCHLINVINLPIYLILIYCFWILFSDFNLVMFRKISFLNLFLFLGTLQWTLTEGTIYLLCYAAGAMPFLAGCQSSFATMLTFTLAIGKHSCWLQHSCRYFFFTVKH